MTHWTIHDDYLVSLIDGQRYLLLRKHIHSRGYTVASYKAAFDLPDDYPMVAANYGLRRSKRGPDTKPRWNPHSNEYGKDPREVREDERIEPTRSSMKKAP